MNNYLVKYYTTNCHKQIQVSEIKKLYFKTLKACKRKATSNVPYRTEVIAIYELDTSKLIEQIFVN